MKEPNCSGGNIYWVTRILHFCVLQVKLVLCQFCTYTFCWRKITTARYPPSVRKVIHKKTDKKCNVRSYMQSFRSRVFESIVSDNLSVDFGWCFWLTRSFWITEVYVVHAKSFRISCSPLEIVHQWPGGVGLDISSINPDSWELITIQENIIRPDVKNWEYPISKCPSAIDFNGVNVTEIMPPKIML